MDILTGVIGAAAGAGAAAGGRAALPMGQVPGGAGAGGAAALPILQVQVPGGAGAGAGAGGGAYALPFLNFLQNLPHPGLPFLQVAPGVAARGAAQAGGADGAADDGAGMRQLWARVRHEAWRWTLGYGLQFAGAHPVATSVAATTATAVYTLAPRGLDYLLQNNELYTQGCDDYRRLYIKESIPSYDQELAKSLEGLYTLTTGTRRLQEQLEREAREELERDANHKFAERQRLDKEKRDRERKWTFAFLRKQAEKCGRAGQEEYQQLRTQARVEFVSRLMFALFQVAGVLWLMGSWWAGSVSLFLSILVAGLIRNAFVDFGLEKIVELLVRAGEGLTSSKQKIW